jgi:glycine betaine catabolism B
MQEVKPNNVPAKKRDRPKAIKWETELLEIIDESPDTKTFRFEKPENWTFIPGQFVMVFFPEVFGKKNRAYSIASSPNSPYIDLTIKLYGVFTHHMWTLKEGSSWTLRGPYGHFILDMERKNDIILIGAGVGVTPLMSMLRWSTEEKIDRRFLLLYSNKTPRDIVFNEEIQMIQKMNPNVKVVHTLTRLKQAPRNMQQMWPGLTGRISAELIQEQVSDWQKEGAERPTVYGCGPAAMLTTMEEVMLKLGWPKEEIHYEKFW